MREADLDPRRLPGGEVTDVRLARERGGEGRLPDACEAIEVVGDPGRRFPEHRGGLRLRVGHERSQRGEGRIGINAFEEVTEVLAGLPHRRRGNEQPERVEQHSNLVAVGVRDQSRLENAVVVLLPR